MSLILSFVLRPNTGLPDTLRGYVRGATEQEAKALAPEGALFFPFNDLWPGPADTNVAVMTR